MQFWSMQREQKARFQYYSALKRTTNVALTSTVSPEPPEGKIHLRAKLKTVPYIVPISALKTKTSHTNADSPEPSCRAIMCYRWEYGATPKRCGRALRCWQRVSQSIRKLGASSCYSNLYMCAFQTEVLCVTREAHRYRLQ